MTTPAPDNPFGMTRYAWWSDLAEIQSGTKPLRDQLTAQNVTFEEEQIPYIVGMAGTAALLFYTSPRTGQPVTVFCIPHRYDVDSWAEDYYYFEGLSKDEALAKDWSEVYDFARAL